MAQYGLPPVNTAYIMYIGLIDQSNTKLLKANPTIASGDFQSSLDGAAFGNLATLPTVTPASGRAVKCSFSAAEMNGDNIFFQAVDAAGAEWCDQAVNIQTMPAALFTVLPTAAAGANTGLPIVGTQIPNATAGANNGLPVQGGAIPNANAGASGGLVEIGTSTNNFKSDASAQVTAASVQGNVTGSVASVTGNVGGNVTGSVGSINLSQALTQHDVSALSTSTVGDALSAARAQGAGEWDLTGVTLTLKNPDGSTFRTLTLDSATAPTSRS